MMTISHSHAPLALATPLSPRRKSGRRGFTLVEMFIVGALISLFAGLAVFNIQQQFNTNKRKATIGEARQLATAISFARLDTGIYPKIPFLRYSHKQLEFESLTYSQANPSITGGINQKYFFNFLDAYGMGTGSLAPKLDSDWQGAYFSAATARTGVSQGTGGLVQMKLRDIDVNGSFSITYPADPYGNPWTLYLASINLTTQQPYFITSDPSGTPSPTTKPDYFTAIVSYGPNRIPGGGPSFDPGNATGILNARLYLGDYRVRDYSSLLASEYNIAPRPQAISKRFGTASLAPADDGNPAGIVDAGSDDIVFEF